MKKLRLILIVLAAPAVILLGLHEIGGTPIFKGYDVGFVWQPDPSNVRLALTADPEGNMTCWLRLKVPASSPAFTAETSTNARLRVYRERFQGADQWIAVVKDSQVPQEKFDWPSGAMVFVYPQDKSLSSLTVNDWYVFPSNKNFDSSDRAKWRKTWFHVSIVLLLLSLIGAIFEAVEKVRKKETDEPFTPQLCMQLLIHAMEGRNPEESERIRSLLEKVLMQGVPLTDALAPVPLNAVQKQQLWFATRGQFRARLAFLINELTRYLSRL
ncbi:MAG TPA: hypothetical protein VGL91_14600 [Acidobacteriota bacterium]